MSAAIRPELQDDAPPAHPLELMLKQVTIEREHLAPGTAIGSFVLRQVIERDDFGLLYLATASASGMEVTIEEFLPAALATRGEDGVLRPRSDAQAELLAAGLQAFLQESDQLSRLSHPALVRIGPVWQTRGTAFRLRLDLPGSTLAALRPEQRVPPSETWLRGLALPLLGALERLHETGLTHGNVRPGRVMVQPDGTPLLMDFGAAREAIIALAPWLGGLPEAEYRAPELLDPRTRVDAGPPADLYALAALLRYCITGEAPVAAGRRREGERAPRLADVLPALRQRHAEANYSDSLVAVIDRAMALEPRERPQSTAEFRADMERMPPARPRPAEAAAAAPPVLPVAAAVEPVAAASVPPAAEPEPQPALHPLQVAALAAMQAQPAAAAATATPVPFAPEPWGPLQAAAMRERQQQEAARSAPVHALRDEPVFDFEPESAPQIQFQPGTRRPFADLSIEPDARGREPHFAAVATPQLDWSRQLQPRSRPWTWAIGGLLIGAVLTATLALGVRRVADDARLAWASITSSLPPLADATPAPESARSPAAAAPGPSARSDVATAPPAAASAAVAATTLPPLAPAAEGGAGRGTPVADAASATVAPVPLPAPSASPSPTAQTAPTPPTGQPAQIGQTAQAPQAAPPPLESATAPAPSPARTAAVGPTRPATVAPAPARTATANPPAQRAPARAVEPPAVERAAASERARPPLVSPAAACAPRSNFSLYQCMKSKCQEDAYYTHPQCIRLRRTDEVS